MIPKHTIDEAVGLLRRYGVENPSTVGAKAFALMCFLESGAHHVPWIRQVDWTVPNGCHVFLRGDLATFDFNTLTRLVFLAHDCCLRVEIQKPLMLEQSDDPAFQLALANGEAEDTHSHMFALRAFITEREREGDFQWDVHPTVEQALAEHRKKFSGWASAPVESEVVS